MYNLINVYDLAAALFKMGKFKSVTGRNGPGGYEFSFLSEDGKVIGTAHNRADGSASFADFKSKEDSEKFEAFVETIKAKGWVVKTHSFGDLPVDNIEMVLGEIADALRIMKQYGGKKRQEKIVAIKGHDVYSWKLADTAANRLRITIPEGAQLLFRDPIQ